MTEPDQHAERQKLWAAQNQDRVKANRKAAWRRTKAQLQAIRDEIKRREEKK